MNRTHRLSKASCALMLAGFIGSLALAAEKAEQVDPATAVPPPELLADLNQDNSVDAMDLTMLITAWGVCPDTPECPADLDGDSLVDHADLIILLNNWTG